MNEFAQLRTRARDKRDLAIAQAHKDYENTLTQIAALEKDLFHKLSPRFRKASACITSVIPTDAPFTTVDVRAALEALDSGRVWRHRLIENQIYRLRERGIIRRLSRASINSPAVYVRADLPIKSKPIEDMTLRQALRLVLKDRSLTIGEVAMAVKEAGYKSIASPNAFRNYLRGELERGKFVKAGGKWSAN